jgi:mono/diheme cytochrome c family protein
MHLHPAFVFAIAATVLPLGACTGNFSGPAAQAPPVAAAGPASPTDAELLARGKYLVVIAGCNDCHTAGYGENSGNVPEAQWLQGSPLGYHGPWGTTYAANLRLKAAEMDEAAWLKYTGELRTRPIMPDFVLRQMQEDDRRAIYRYLRGLGPAGQPAPAYLPPGQTPPAPYFQLVLPPAGAQGSPAPAG